MTEPGSKRMLKGVWRGIRECGLGYVFEYDTWALNSKIAHSLSLPRRVSLNREVLAQIHPDIKKVVLPLSGGGDHREMILTEEKDSSPPDGKPPAIEIIFSHYNIPQGSIWAAESTPGIVSVGITESGEMKLLHHVLDSKTTKPDIKKNLEVINSLLEVFIKPQDIDPLSCQDF